MATTPSESRAAVVAKAVFLMVAVGLLVHTDPAQAQESDDTLYESVEACQRVTKKHAMLAASTVRSTLQQLADTNDTMARYLRRWASRVAAEEPGGAAVAGVVAECATAYETAAGAVATSLRGNLDEAVTKQIEWYDAKVFSLFTDVLTDAARAGIVQSVQGNLEPALKVLANLAVSHLKQSVKDLKPAYQTAARCVRDQALLVDDFPEHH